MSEPANIPAVRTPQNAAVLSDYAVVSEALSHKLVADAGLAKSQESVAHLAKSYLEFIDKLATNTTFKQRRVIVSQAKRLAYRLIEGNEGIDDSERERRKGLIDTLTDEALEILTSEEGHENYLPRPLDRPRPLSIRSAYLNRASGDAAIGLPGGSLVLRTGFFITEQESADIYGGASFTPVEKKGKWLQGAIDLQFFVDRHMPFADELDRVSVYASHPEVERVDNYSATFQPIPSALLFLGSEQKVNEILSFREGIQTSPYLVLGRQVTQSDFWFPITAGASSVMSFGALQMAVGATVDFPVTNADQQDVLSIRPAFERVSPFAALASGIVNLDVGLDVYRDSGDGHIGISRDFTFTDGMSKHVIGVGVDASSQLWGDFPYRGSYAMFGLRYSFLNGKHHFRADIEATMNPLAGLDADDDNYLYDAELTYIDPAELNKDAVSIPDSACGGDISEATSCDPGAATLSEDPYWAYVEPAWKKRAYHKFHGAFDKYESLDDFIVHLKGDSVRNKLEYLSELRDVIYGSYYDDAAEKWDDAVSDKANKVGYQEIYEEARKLDPDDTTVCRGFAKFVTHVASEWGLEARSVSHLTGGKWKHVISVVKVPGKDQFYFVDGGQIIEGETFLEAMETFNRTRGIGPSSYYKLYDGDGKFVRHLETPYGQNLRTRTTPPSRIDPFLKGR